jgi:tetratricopeptide (TPR) repeat protein
MRDNLSEMLKIDSSNARPLRELGIAHYRIGRMLQRMGDDTGAAEELALAIAVREELVGRNPKNPNWAQDLASAHIALGQLYLGIGRNKEALEQFEMAAPIVAEFAKADPSNAGLAVRLAWAARYKGSALRSEKKLVEVERVIGESIEALRGLYADRPDNQDVLAELAECLTMRGDIAREQEYEQRARESWLEALDLLDAASGESKPAPPALEARARILIRFKRFDEAAAVLKEMDDRLIWAPGMDALKVELVEARKRAK